MKFFIFLLVINFIVVVIYVIWNHLRGKEKNLSTWMKAIVMLLCPVVGPTFLCAAFLLYKLFMSQAMDLSDVVFSKERVKTFIPPDEERGRNMVSIGGYGQKEPSYIYDECDPGRLSKIFVFDLTGFE